MSQDKTVSWQIPRVSLNGSSSSSGSESLRHARRNSAPSHESGSQELKYFSKSLEMKNAQGNLKKLEPDKRRMSCDNNLPGRKRGSHSSQGSSNNSTFVSSSSLYTVLFLTVFQFEFLEHIFPSTNRCQSGKFCQVSGSDFQIAIIPSNSYAQLPQKRRFLSGTSQRHIWRISQRTHDHSDR
jgi:hypothetical protein